MSIATVVTRGYGLFGGITPVTLRGYSANPGDTVKAREAFTMRAQKSASITMIGAQSLTMNMTGNQAKSFTAILRVDLT